MDNERIIFTQSNNNRYVIADKVSGRIIDDAQGYGYKTLDKAKAAWAWKTRNSVEFWMENNMDFSRAIDLTVRTLRGYGLDPKVYITERMLSEVLLEYGITTLPFKMNAVKDFIFMREEMTS